ncbi:MAG: hypothetical protein HPY64_11440 [Anaerolineae bacterium]|nr:hypothetical protein [Anaerolineae bacterium]
MAATEITLLYTARLAGRLDLLPRLFGSIQAARAASAGPVILLDLGGSCHPAAWECAATEGRAALFVLEAMGYDLACLSVDDCQRMSPGAAQRLQEATHLPICGAVELGLPPVVTVEAGGQRIACQSPAAPQAAVPPGISLLIRPDEAGQAPRLESAARTLWLPLPDGALGAVAVSLAQDDAGRWKPVAIAQLPVVAVPERADPVIAATVAFVREEARLYRRRLEQPQETGQGGRS